ncbi:alpha/beta hydrolase [Sesbania bispinosa]|nr:alpha/beta hydrolase [Sesbania bispinosa]
MCWMGDVQCCGHGFNRFGSLDYEQQRLLLRTVVGQLKWIMLRGTKGRSSTMLVTIMGWGGLWWCCFVFAMVVMQREVDQSGSSMGTLEASEPSEVSSPCMDFMASCLI